MDLKAVCLPHTNQQCCRLGTRSPRHTQHTGLHHFLDHISLNELSFNSKYNVKYLHMWRNSACYHVEMTLVHEPMSDPCLPDAAALSQGLNNRQLEIFVYALKWISISLLLLAVFILYLIYKFRSWVQNYCWMYFVKSVLQNICTVAQTRLTFLKSS